MWTYLPRSDVLNFAGHRSLEGHTEFKCVRPDLDDIVQDGPERRYRVNGRKQNYIAELDEHLQIIIERALVTIHLALTGRLGNARIVLGQHRYISQRTRTGNFISGLKMFSRFGLCIFEKLFFPTSNL